MDALGSYNPQAGTRIQSHVFNHLKGLKRFAGKLGQGVSVPERVVLDRRAADLATKELTDQLGRPPNDDELSDHTGLSGKRLAYVRGYSPAVTESGFAGGAEEGESNDPAVRGPESDSWLRVVYDELSPSDKLIFEHSIGWAGKPVKANQEIATMLRRSPGWISQRKLAIQKQLDQRDDLGMNL
jgi:DNA-directed RNA polymerase specialized sigma subunit